MRYAWGSVDLLPALMGTRPDGRPLAEIWMGAHAAAPSSVEIDGHDVGLDDLIARFPHQTLGADILKESGAKLPFMMKLLAADRPLSLQVHPSREQAEEGYRREDEAGIPLTDPSRNYRDIAHKPELLFALRPFEMLCGFRPVEAIRDFALWTCTPGPTADSAAGVTVEGPPSGARIAVCCAGQCALIRRAEQMELRPGQAAFIPHSDGPLGISATGTVAVACSRSSLSAISRG